MSDDRAKALQRVSDLTAKFAADPKSEEGCTCAVMVLKIIAKYDFKVIDATAVGPEMSESERLMRSSMERAAHLTKDMDPNRPAAGQQHTCVFCKLPISNLNFMVLRSGERLHMRCHMRCVIAFNAAKDRI